MPFKQVEAEAKEAGISVRRVRRAAQRAGVESVREGFTGLGAGNVWRLKGTAYPAGEPC
jgi:hypothetical protein